MRRKAFRTKKTVKNNDNTEQARQEEFTTLPVEEEPEKDSEIAEVEADEKEAQPQAEEEPQLEGEEDIVEEDDVLEEVPEEGEEQDDAEKIELPQFNIYGTPKTDLIFLFFILFILLSQSEIDLIAVFLLFLLIVDIV